MQSTAMCINTSQVATCPVCRVDNTVIASIFTTLRSTIHKVETINAMFSPVFSPFTQGTQSNLLGQVTRQKKQE